MLTERRGVGIVQTFIFVEIQTIIKLQRGDVIKSSTNAARSVVSLTNLSGREHHRVETIVCTRVISPRVGELTRQTEIQWNMLKRGHIDSLGLIKGIVKNVHADKSSMHRCHSANGIKISDFRANCRGHIARSLSSINVDFPIKHQCLSIVV